MPKDRKPINAAESRCFQNYLWQYAAESQHISPASSTETYCTEKAAFVKNWRMLDRKNSPPIDKGGKQKKRGGGQIKNTLSETAERCEHRWALGG